MNIYSRQILMGLLVFIVLVSMPSLHAFSAVTIRNVPSFLYPTIQAGINAATSVDPVVVASGEYKGAGDGRDLYIDHQILGIYGAGPGLTTIDAESLGRAISVDASVADITIQGLTIKNGLPQIAGPGLPGENGGAVHVASAGTKLTVKYCNFTNNRPATASISHSSGSHGGAIYTLGTLEIDASSFEANFASDDNSGADGGHGGAIYTAGKSTIKRTMFKNNHAGNGTVSGGSGGAIVTLGLTLEGCIFIGNYSGNGSSAIGGSNGAVSATNATIKDCMFISNRTGDGGFSASSGGAIGATYLNISGSHFEGNRIGTSVTGNGGSGGAIYCLTHALMKNCQFISNEAGAAGSTGVLAGQGGAAYIIGHALITTCEVVNNKAGKGYLVSGPTSKGGDGGAFWINDSSIIIDCKFTSNEAGDGQGSSGSAGYGGAIFAGSQVTVETTEFTGNKAGSAIGAGGGGAIYAYNNADIVASSFSYNHSGVGIGGAPGGAIMVGSNSNKLRVINSEFIRNFTPGNQSGGDGGAIFSNAKLTQVFNSIFAKNKAGDAGQQAGNGGALACISGEVYNCLFYENATGITSGSPASYAGKGGGIYMDNGITKNVVNSIFWDNTAQTPTSYGTAIYSNSSIANVDYCDFKNGDVNEVGGSFLSGPHNISDIPRFISTSEPFDFNMEGMSPCINTGTNDGGKAPTYAIDGTLRPQGAGYDMGPYEKGISSRVRVLINGSIAQNNDVVSINNNTVTVIATYEVGVATVELTVDGTDRFALTNVSGSVWQGNFIISQKDQQNHVLSFRIEDSLGNNEYVNIAVITYSGSVQVVGTPYNYPNPFKPLSSNPGENSTSIQYTLSADAPVKIVVYDITGKEVKRMSFSTGSNGGRAGVNTASWNGKSMFNEVAGNGMYVYKIISGNRVIGNGKLVILD